MYPASWPSASNFFGFALNEATLDRGVEKAESAEAVGERTREGRMVSIVQVQLQI